MSITLNDGNPTDEIRLFANNDEITLEYDDEVELMFTPGQAGLVTGLLSMNECLRTTAMVHIIDNDRKCVCVSSEFTIVSLSSTAD